MDVDENVPNNLGIGGSTHRSRARESHSMRTMASPTMAGILQKKFTSDLPLPRLNCSSSSRCLLNQFELNE